VGSIEATKGVLLQPLDLMKVLLDVEEFKKAEKEFLRPAIRWRKCEISGVRRSLSGPRASRDPNPR
jgi:hypothetical protein